MTMEASTMFAAIKAWVDANPVLFGVLIVGVPYMLVDASWNATVQRRLDELDRRLRER